jgi:hypothetical protein
MKTSIVSNLIQQGLQTLHSIFLGPAQDMQHQTSSLTVLHAAAA